MDEEGDGLAEPSLFLDHDEEMTLESPRKRQEVQEVMKKTEWRRLHGKRREEEKYAWGLEPERETEMREVRVVSDGVEGIYVDLDGEGHHERERVKKTSRRQSDVPGEEGEEIKSPKRKINSGGI